MSDPNWQDHFLSDILETQLLLFLHLARALEDAGILPRGASAAVLRRTAEQDVLRPGVGSCLRAVAALLERAEDKPAPRPWRPRLVPGGEAEEGAGGRADGGADGPPTAGRSRVGNGHAGNGRAGNGHAGNGSLPPRWRPRLVGEPDPDADPDADFDPDPDCA